MVSKILLLSRWLSCFSLSSLLLSSCGSSSTSGPIIPSVPDKLPASIEFKMRVGQAKVSVDQFSGTSLSAKSLRMTSRASLQTLGINGELRAGQTTAQYANFIWKLTKDGKPVSSDLKLNLQLGNTSTEITHKAGYFWDDLIGINVPSGEYSLAGTLEGQPIGVKASLEQGTAFDMLRIGDGQLTPRGITWNLYGSYSNSSQVKNYLLQVFRDPDPTNDNASLELIAVDSVDVNKKVFNAVFDPPLPNTGTYLISVIATSWASDADRRKPFLDTTFNIPSSALIIGKAKMQQLDSVVKSIPTKVDIVGVVGQEGETSFSVESGSIAGNTPLIYELEVDDPNKTIYIDGPTSSKAPNPDQLQFDPMAQYESSLKVKAQCSSVGVRNSKLILRTNSSTAPKRTLPVTVTCVNPVQAKNAWSRDSENIDKSVLSPDGTLLAIISKDRGYSSDGSQTIKRSLKIRRSSDGALVREISDFFAQESLLAWSPDQSMLALTTRDQGNSLRIWNTVDGSLKAATALPAIKTGWWKTFTHLSFSPDGKKILVGAVFEGTSGIIYNADAGKLNSLPASESGICFGWNPEGKTIGTFKFTFASLGDKDATLFAFYDSTSMSQVKQSTFGVPIISEWVQWNADGKTLIVQGRPHDIYLWDIASEKILHQVKNNIYSSQQEILPFNKGSGFLVWSSAFHSTYDWEKQEPVSFYDAFDAPSWKKPKGVEVSPDGKELYVRMDNTTEVLNRTDLSRIRVLGGHGDAVLDTRVLTNGQVLSIGKDKMARASALADGAEQKVWKSDDFGIDSSWVIPNPQGTKVVIGGTSDLAYIFDSATKKQEKILPLPFSFAKIAIPSIAWNNDGSKVAFLGTGYNASSDLQKSYAIFSSEGKLLVSGFLDKNYSSDDQINPMLSISWTADGKIVRIYDDIFDAEKYISIKKVNFSKGRSIMNPEGSKIMTTYSFYNQNIVLGMSEVNSNRQTFIYTPANDPITNTPYLYSSAVTWSSDGTRIALAVTTTDINSFAPNNYKILLLSASSLKPLQAPLLENLPTISSLNWLQKDGKDYLAIGFQSGSIRLVALE